MKKIDEIMMDLINSDTPYNNQIKELVGIFSEILTVPDNDLVKDNLLNKKNGKVEKSLELFEECVIKGLNLNECVDIFKTKWPNDIFWNAFLDEINQAISPFLDTTFFRKYTPDLKKDFLREIIENQILMWDNTEVVIERLNRIYNCNITHTEITTGCDMIEMMEDLIIGSRVSKKVFVDVITDVFHFDEDEIFYAWDIMNKNKDDFFRHYVVKKINELKP